MVGLLLIWLACSAREPSQAPVETGTAPASIEPYERDPVCDRLPSVTWDNHVYPLVLTHCQSCHASATLERHGAPADAIFDTEADALRQVENIEKRVLDQLDMPPAGGVEESDLELMSIWLSCTIER